MVVRITYDEWIRGISDAINGILKRKGYEVTDHKAVVKMIGNHYEPDLYVTFVNAEQIFSEEDVESLKQMEL